ncbi:unnamed protein product [Thelazia callipaeda]|uniref:Triokinase/FMN cyclase n=1 Tax=Thelazia callipaeda TaxID=103827 RepID=A0A0N5DC03_THECL|nr:unnamed protein product [Thelazia callipaeda]
MGRLLNLSLVKNPQKSLSYSIRLQSSLTDASRQLVKMTKKTNKFINSAENAVDDGIKGLVLSHDNLATLDSCHRVVLRADVEQLKGGKQVTLLAGGGSGHEPFAAGFVGKGLLSAAICGNVFASPPTSHITAGLNAIRNRCNVSPEYTVKPFFVPAGIGVFVINYTGDRLNFGLAVERFNTCRGNEDGAAEMVLIGDDIALENNLAGSDIGRRGLAGAVLLLKIAGALAEEGTIGVSLSACSLPGRGPMFELENDRMEFGLGIHGEPGCERSQYRTAKEVAKLLLEKLEKSQKLSLRKGEKLVVLLNNLGGTSQLELNILAGEICSWLYENGYEIERFYVETVMTSLDGHGISVTIVRLVSDDWLRLLDAATEAPSWKMKYFLPKPSSSITKIKSTESRKDSGQHSGATLSQENAKRVEAAVKKACLAIQEAVDKLNDLDGSAGDGDCGSTLKIGADKVLKCLNEGRLLCDKPQALLTEISQIFEDDVGGTAGALYALMFSSAAQSFSRYATTKEWYLALRNGLETIMKYGQAKPGHRSMVDPLNAAVTSISSDTPERADWENAVKEAEESAKATSIMRAQVGRASYTSASVQKEPDAGAIAVSIWLKAIYEAVYS